MECWVIFSFAVMVLLARIHYSAKSILDPILWTNPFPLPPLSASFSVNNMLTNVEFICAGKCTAPESMAMDSSTGVVYVSLNDGTVALISATGLLLSTVFFVGGYMRSPIEKRSNGIVGSEELMTWCKDESKAGKLAWNSENERKCGRPLGLRLLNKKLYVLDAYHGLFCLDLVSSEAEHLISPETAITVPEWHSGLVDRTSLLPPKFFNDLDIIEASSTDVTDVEGGLKVYFTDTSYKNTRSQNRVEILDGAPRGRVLSYNIPKKVLKVLLCGLHFPNGVQALNKDEVLVVESTRFRVIKINLKNLERERGSLLNSCAENGSLSNYINSKLDTPKSVSVFLDEVPGFMDNIRVDSLSLLEENGSKNFFIGLGTKSSQPFSLLWHAYQLMFLRDLIGKYFPMKYVEHLVPKYGLVIIVDQNGVVLRSLHDPKGTKMSMVSEAQRHPVTGDLWLGSHSNPFIGKLSAQALNE